MTHVRDHLLIYKPDLLRAEAALVITAETWRVFAPFVAFPLRPNNEGPRKVTCCFQQGTALNL